MNDSDYAILQVSAKDQDLVVKLVNEAYWHHQQPFFLDIPASYERLNLAQFDCLMHDSTKTVFKLVRRSNLEILGVIAIEISPEKENAKFGLFAMNRNHSGKKLGRLLIEYVENYALEKGRKLMVIEVFTFATRLAAYYERLGYACTGKTARFFHECCIHPEYQSQDKYYLNEMIKIL